MCNWSHPVDGSTFERWPNGGDEAKGLVAFSIGYPKAIPRALVNTARYLRSPTPQEIGFIVRNVGLVALAVGVGAAPLTFHWIVVHRPEANFVGEFAGAVLYPSDILVFTGLLFWFTGWYLSPDLRLRYGPWYLFLPLFLLTVLTMISPLWSIYATQAAFIALRRILIWLSTS